MLVNGQWTRDWDPVQKKDAQGRFIRQQSTFRGTVSPKAVESDAPSEQAPWRLYVAYICPWASRTLIARQLLGLEPWVELRVVNPVMTDEGWRFGGFPGATGADVPGVSHMHQLYTASQADYTGRATVPVLWDNRQQRIINNESADILRLFDQQLRPLHQSSRQLYPESLRAAIDEFNDWLYPRFNNGVYRAGFASSQQAYEEAVQDVFGCLEQLEQHFATHEFAVGEQLTESDIRLFVTLARFDPAYHGLFKTNRKRLSDYPALSAYFERLLQIPAFADNTRIDHIKAGYYSVKALNPKGIVPVGPDLPWYRWLSSGVPTN